MKRILIGALVLALTVGVAACGQEAEEPTVDAAAAQAEASPTVEDTDGDGVVDDQDSDPYSAEAGGVDGATDEQVEPEPEPESDDCDALGINPAELNEGACTDEDGNKVKVVNRDSRLMLEEVGVRLVNIAAVDTIPVSYDTPLTGSFVVATVAVTNRMDAPVDIDASSMFELALDGKAFTADADAMIEGDASTGLIYETIQPDQTVTGDVIFRVAPKRIDSLETDGIFVTYQFSDVDSWEPPAKRAGIIRTYN